jgi:hypothetical protein
MRYFKLLGILAIALGIFSINIPASAQGSPFSFSWALGTPSTPQVWDYQNQGNFDVIVHTRGQNNDQHVSIINAQHGADCGAYQPTLATHPVTDVTNSLFICNNHMMTALSAPDYGVIYMTPPVLVDFSQSAVVKFDVSTLRSSDRDWIDAWLTPFNENLVLPLGCELACNVDLNGPPKDSIHINMDQYNSGTIFRAITTNNFSETTLGSDWWDTLESRLGPSANTRTTFELDLTPTHIRFGIPSINFWWIDHSMSVNFTQAVLQLGHHSYDPTKGAGCGPPPEEKALGLGCQPDTWHWSNLSISNAIPFTIDQGAPTFTGNNGTITLTTPAPANGFLRFAAQSAFDQVNVSFDGGPFQPAVFANESKHAPAGNNYGHWDSFWMPIPAGTQTITFQGTDPCCSLQFSVRDVTVWSQSNSPIPSPSPSPSISPSPSPSPIPSPSPLPSPTPSPSPSPSPVASPSPSPIPSPCVGDGCSPPPPPTA